MAYSKTTWVNDTTTVDETKMNNIESGLETADSNATSAKTKTDFMTVTQAVNIDNMEGDIDRIENAVDGAGSVNAQTVTVNGSFSFQDGILLPYNPAYTNTGSMTLNVNGLGVKSVKKWDIDTSAYVELDAYDITKNAPVWLRYDSSVGFFVYAPRKGNPIKQIISSVVTFYAGETVVYKSFLSGKSVDMNYAVVFLSGTQSSDNTLEERMASLAIYSDTSIRGTRSASTDKLVCTYTVIEWHPWAIKAIDRSTHVLPQPTSNNSAHFTLSNCVDKDKILFFYSISCAETSGTAKIDIPIAYVYGDSSWTLQWEYVVAYDIDIRCEIEVVEFY